MQSGCREIGIRVYTLTLLAANRELLMMTSFAVNNERPPGHALMQILKLLASVMFQEIEISHLCDVTMTTCPLVK